VRVGRNDCRISISRLRTAPATQLINQGRFDPVTTKK
jgi:hypothetical protein